MVSAWQVPAFVFVVVQSLCCVRLFTTQRTVARQAPLNATISPSLLKFRSTEWVTLSNHLNLCCPPLLLPSIFPRLRVFFSNEWALCIRWPSIGASALATVLPMTIQGWFPLGLTGSISLQAKGLSTVFSRATIGKYQFFCTQSSLWSNSHTHMWLLEKP